MTNVDGPLQQTTDRPRIPVGISACLLGSAVRFDGGHQRDRYATDVLGEHFRWVASCPEVGIGLPTPRESLRLVGDARAPRLVAPRSGTDHSEAMLAWSRARVEELAAQGIRGYILKKSSPSCGLERVRVYGDSGMASRDGRGLFAQVLAERLPNLPLEEDGRLADPGLRESFVNRVFAYDRWLRLREDGAGAAALVAFHTRHKLLLLAHDPAGYRRLGRLVAEQAARPLPEVLDEYESGLMRALARPTSVRRHVDVLQHLLGFLKRELPGDDRRAILAVVEDYRRGFLPLAAPLALLRHALAKVRHPWVESQVYLQPHPKELAAWAS